MSLPHHRRVSASRLFLQACSAPEVAGHVNALWLEAEARLLLADSFVDCAEPQEAEEEFRRAEAVIDLYTCGLPTEDKRILAPYLRIRWKQLGMIPDDDEHLRVRHSTSLKLLESMKATYSIYTDCCYYLAADTALRISRLPDASDYRETYFRLNQEMRDYQETVMDDISGLLLSYKFLAADSNWRQTDARMILELYDGFLKHHGDFMGPSLAGMHTMRSDAYLLLGERENARIAQAESDKWKSYIPKLFGPNVGLSHPIECGETISHEFLETTLVSAEENCFFTEWNFSPDSGETTEETASRLLLKWMKEDGLRLKQDELVAILQPDCPSEAVQHTYTSSNLAREELAEITEEALYLRLYWNNSQPVLLSTWINRFTALDTWLRRPSRSPRNGRHYLLWTLQALRGECFFSYRADLGIFMAEARRCLALLPTLADPVQELLKTAAADWNSKIALRILKSIQFSDNNEPNHTLMLLDEAQECCVFAINELSKASHGSLAVMQQIEYAYICRLKIAYGSTIPKQERRRLRDLGLENLRCVDNWVSYYRAGLSWSNDLKSLQLGEIFTEKQQSLTLAKAWTFTQLAVSLLASDSNDRDGDDENTRQDMWNWVQKSKARSLAEAMGLNSADPRVQLKHMLASSSDVALLQEEKSLLDAIEKSALHHRFHLRVQYRDLQAKMRKVPELKRVLDLRDGTPLELQELEQIQHAVGTPILFVDWFYVPSPLPGRQGRIFLITARGGETPTTHDLSISPSDVAEWVNTYLTPRPENDDDDVLRRHMTHPNCRKQRFPKLEALVQPLAALSRPGDLLVFCPTDLLHRIPLHALEIQIDPNDVSKGKEVLIRRNPIVYCHSLSTLRTCFWSSKAAAASTESYETAIFHHVTDKGSDRGRKSVHDLAARLGTTPYMDTAATKKAFVDVSARAGLLHVHSHISSKDADPLQHHILLHTEENSVDSSIVTTRDVFSMSLPPGCHVTLIACSGGRFRVNSGDEVLGLVPAFLYSGASSTISTLWDIPDSVGARFTEQFYDTLMDGRCGDEVSGWDLAKAFQRAVVELDDKGKKPLFYWAGFVLHGYWILQTLTAGSGVDESGSIDTNSSTDSK